MFFHSKQQNFKKHEAKIDGTAKKNRQKSQVIIGDFNTAFSKLMEQGDRKSLRGMKLECYQPT